MVEFCQVCVRVSWTSIIANFHIKSALSLDMDVVNPGV